MSQITTNVLQTKVHSVNSLRIEVRTSVEESFEVSQSTDTHDTHYKYRYTRRPWVWVWCFRYLIMVYAPTSFVLVYYWCTWYDYCRTQLRRFLQVPVFRLRSLNPAGEARKKSSVMDHNVCRINTSLTCVTVRVDSDTLEVLCVEELAISSSESSTMKGIL